jgi:hypothetical protein
VRSSPLARFKASWIVGLVGIRTLISRRASSSGTPASMSAATWARHCWWAATLRASAWLYRPAGGAYMAAEILPLSSGGVESEPERPELLGVGHVINPDSGCRLRGPHAMAGHRQPTAAVPTPPDGLPWPGGWRRRGGGGSGSWIPSVSTGAR